MTNETRQTSYEAAPPGVIEVSDPNVEVAAVIQAGKLRDALADHRDRQADFRDLADDVYDHEHQVVDGRGFEARAMAREEHRQAKEDRAAAKVDRFTFARANTADPDSSVDTDSLTDSATDPVTAEGRRAMAENIDEFLRDSPPNSESPTVTA